MLKTIAFTDITLREEAHRIDNALSFKEKIEIAKQLDKLQVDAIEFAPLQDEKADTLLIKTVAALVRQSAVALPIALTQESIAASWEAIRHAAHPRLVVSVPTSPIQMAYTCQKRRPPYWTCSRSLSHRPKPCARRWNSPPRMPAAASCPSWPRHLRGNRGGRFCHHRVRHGGRLPPGGMPGLCSNTLCPGARAFEGHALCAVR